MADTPLTLWLDDTGADAGPLVGGKFSSLAEMSQAGFGVPPAFAVTTASYRSFLAHHGFADELAAVKTLDRDDLDAVDRVSATITRAIENADLPSAVRTAGDEKFSLAISCRPLRRRPSSSSKTCAISGSVPTSWS